MVWTKFMDMHSGGGTKEAPFEYIYIEAPIEEAKVIFFNKFGHNPDRVSCTCCGNDYSIDESETKEQATAYERGCHWDKEGSIYLEKKDEGRFAHREYLNISEYISSPDVLFINSDDIKPEWRGGEIPSQGYVWVG